MTNKFYGIGVGVGDPEEITIKAINTLKKLDVVILPEAKKDDGSVAYEIAKQYMKEDVEKVFVEFPMPGISSFVDMASRFNFPLMIGDETLKVVSLNRKTNIEFELENNDNIVFMKVSRNFESLKEALIKTKNIDKIIMVSNCGKENQKVYYDIKNLTEEDIPYFTTLIVKKGGFEKWKKFTL